MTSPARLREMVGEEPRYLLVKRDLYYAPNNQGYTGVKARAGRYHASEADPESGVTAIHEDDAPMFSKACWEDVKVKTLLDDLDARDRRIAELEALRADAERWRAFISSERFYVMGAAGFTWEPPAVDPDRDKDNWLHFTLNVWDKHPAGDDAQGRHGRALLLAYVEHLRTARAALEARS